MFVKFCFKRAIVIFLLCFFVKINIMSEIHIHGIFTHC